MTFNLMLPKKLLNANQAQCHEKLFVHASSPILKQKESLIFNGITINLSTIQVNYPPEDIYGCHAALQFLLSQSI